MADAKCLACLDAKQLTLAKLALLCAINQALNPMATCDPATLMQQGKCFACLDAKQAQMVELQLLCNIAGDGGGGGGMGGITSGIGNPVGPPVSGNGLYLNLSNSTLWGWNSSLGLWVELIA